jgi:hypothetical protein
MGAPKIYTCVSISLGNKNNLNPNVNLNNYVLKVQSFGLVQILKGKHKQIIWKNL